MSPSETALTVTLTITETFPGALSVPEVSQKKTEHTQVNIL